jgi:hypothetical protein
MMPILSAIANIAVGSCIPIWACFLLGYLLFLMFTDLVNIASSNAQIDTVSSLLLQARKEAKLMLARASVLGLSGTPAELSLVQHTDLLVTYAAADGCAGRFLGFVVRYGTVRTFAIILFTLIVGL